VRSTCACNEAAGTLDDVIENMARQASGWQAVDPKDETAFGRNWSETVPATVTNAGYATYASSGPKLLAGGAMKSIASTRVCLPYGWLGNMSRHPIRFDGDDYRTCEAFFQALRFDDAVIRQDIRALASPMAAKMRAKTYRDRMVVVPRSGQDVENMRAVLRVKIAQHPELEALLISTGDAYIVEDCTKRANDSGRFWGATWTDGAWRGNNALGTLWMELRTELRLANETV
jgi:N-glycosidase YbiA